MPERAAPQPMSSFDPTRPVVVHEQVNDVEIEWVPVSREKWPSKAQWEDEGQTMIRWDDMVLDHWWPAGDDNVRDPP